MAWLLVILLLPYLGVPLYVMFGGRKMNPISRSKSRIYPAPSAEAPGDAEVHPDDGTARLLAFSGVPPARPGNRIELVTSGTEAHRLILRMIEEARSTIHITTYILGWDAGGRSILDALIRRIGEGVTVRMLIDDLGSWRLPRRKLAPLTRAVVRVAFFMPVFHVPMRGRANLRNHRKLIVVDGRTCLTGGMNLALPYIGPPGSGPLWRDVAVLIEGPAASDLETVFASDWRYATGSWPGEEGGPAPDPNAIAEAVEEHGDATAQVVASGPDVPGEPLYESLLALIFGARERIWIITPYFVPDEMLLRALSLAARRGVDVRLLVPIRSNHVTADLARAGYLRDLHNAGGRVLLYTSEMLHAKAVLFDDRLAVIGSANMDIRSLFLNYELSIFVRSPDEVARVAAWARGLMAHTRRELPRPSWLLEIAENVVRLLSPLL